MRLVELGLVRFGGFTHAVLDLSAPGLHLVVGRNEAGKSTALRAITALFYGIPHKTGDAYVHEELLIAGKLRAADGTELELSRRKGRKNTLRSPSGEPVDERVLSRLFGGVSESVFTTTFGLDHERLRRGGAELASGGGDVGQSLFDAGIGGGSVKRVLDELWEESERLFKPSAHARNPAINEALRAYAESIKRVRTESTRPGAWADQKKELEAARAELAELEARRLEHKRALAEAQELVEVLPLIAKREACERELSAVRDAPLLPENAAELRIQAEKELEATARETRRVEEETKDIDAALCRLVIADELLLEDAAVDALHERLGEYRRDTVDLARSRAKLAASETVVRERLQALGHDPGADARALLPKQRDVARIKALTVERARLDAELLQAKKSQAEARSRLSSLEADLARLASELPPAERELASRELPSSECIEAFRARSERLEKVQEKLEDRRERLEREALDAGAELARLELGGEVPSEAELCRVRDERDRSFEGLRRAAGDVERFDAHERLTRQADELSDRLRREAERVQSFAASEAKRLRVSQELAALASERERFAEERARFDAEWREAWAPAEVSPRSPTEMRAVLERVLRSNERRRELDAARARAALAESERAAEKSESESELGAWSAAWSEAVRHLGLGADATPSEADAMQVALGELSGVVADCDRLRHRIEGMQESATRFEREVEALSTRHLGAAADAARGVEQAALLLISRHRASREALAKKRDLEARRAAAEALGREVLERRAAAEAQLAAALAAAGVAEPRLLPEAEARATARRRAEQELAELERALAEISGSAALGAIRERAAGKTLRDARALVEDLKDTLAEIETARDLARDRVRSAELGLERYDDKQSAADAEVEAQALLAKIRSLSERWAKVRVAWRVLHDEVERYRVTHQAPLLARTNELFPRLTGGAHREIRVDHDAEPPVLCAVTREGQRVPIPSLSDGTRDQLYLALRLASLEHYARESEALPLCLDDVLINFDDERSLAALRVLAEVAGGMQVLLFTHHEHLVEMAVRALSPSQVHVHELRRGEAPATRPREDSLPRS